MNRQTSDVHAFEARATDTDLDDLRARLAAARLPEAETVYRAAPDAHRWAQGVPLADLTDVVHYWRTGYSWRSFEARLNQIGQFRTTIDDLGIHFLHRRSARADATPLILTHGWPGSIAEFAQVIDELADPGNADAPAFHVVVPSLPGFGYSDKPATTGWGTEKIAAAWVTLMERLGYSRFLAHGGDWGGVITTILGGRFPEHVIGIHTAVAQPPPGLTTDGLTATESGSRSPATSGATARHTRSSRRPDRRPSATPSSTHQLASLPGSLTSSPSGRIPRTARSRPSPETVFLTTSPCTG